MNSHHVQSRVLISFTNSLQDFRRSPKPLNVEIFPGFENILVDLAVLPLVNKDSDRNV